MNDFPKTLVIRHRRENLKKCSLRGLEARKDFSFYTYPLKSCPLLTGTYVVLSGEGVELSEKEKECGLILLDATWRYVESMEKNLPFLKNLERRSLPSYVQTAYPRRQNDCPYPQRGLASLEALIAAYTILGRKREELLTHYYWAPQFLEKNPQLRD